ncbi:hypothetical protein [Stenotrophomonas rhizophila]
MKASLVKCIVISAAGAWLAGCSGGNGAAAAHPEPSSPLVIQQITLRSQGADVAEATRPPSISDTLEFRIRSTGGNAGQQLSARLIYLADSTQAVTQDVQLDSAKQPWVIRFEPEEIRKPGRYLLELTDGGRLLQSQELELYSDEQAAQ